MLSLLIWEAEEQHEPEGWKSCMTLSKFPAIVPQFPLLKIWGK